MRKAILLAGAIGVAFFVMRFYGWTLSDVVALAKGDAAQARTDMRDLMSGEYSDRVSRQLREGSAKDSAPRGGGGLDEELNRELAAERKRVMEERARATQDTAAQILKGDTETLKRRTRENVDRVGGTQ